MATNLRLTPGRGGNRHPIAVKQFILDRLAQVGEDYTSSIHRAFKDALDQLAMARGRKAHYHYPTFPSFSKEVRELTQDGLVEFSGREEPSDDHRFDGWENKPLRRYYRLAGGK